MAGSVNKVILIGRLGNDPEVRTAGNGTKIVSFSVATSDRWTDKHSGERQERTEWHRVVVFNEATYEGLIDQMLPGQTEFSEFGGALCQRSRQVFLERHQPFVWIFSQVNHAKTARSELLDNLVAAHDGARGQRGRFRL